MQKFKTVKNIRIILFVLSDILAICLSSILALAIRFDMFLIPKNYLEASIKSYPFYILASIGILTIFKLYNRVWSYASVGEAVDIIKASIFIEISIICFHIFMRINMPRSYYPINFLFILMFLIITRFGKVFFISFKNTLNSKKYTNKIMIIGAGAAASLLIKEIKSSNKPMKVVCAIDDNENKKNKYILDVPIVGGREDIKEASKIYDVNEIIITMPSASAETIKKLIKASKEVCNNVKILPSLAKTFTHSVSKEVRNVNYEDLLGRESIIVNQKGINNFIHGKVVMVTGGGGSIGSELCRQIIKYQPKKLIILDIYENNAYEIQMELSRHYPRIELTTLIASIREEDRLEEIFKVHRPEIIYHAAAHKHVPLMEISPNEAVKNNCYGTLNLAKLADKYEVSNFILISTDKAVRPTNIMGATKRICEMIIQSYAKKSLNTRFAAVRFGNVLGSNGSVIPLFLKQIGEGGPVTVTHKDITRFFMTIPEAVSLVLQASLFAKGGEIFVLDMGNPVKIYELAENLIRLQGFKPNEDIDIEIVGLRPGEKLYEEILMDEEGLDKTENNMIYIGKPIMMNEEEFFENLLDLIEASKKNHKEIKELTAKLCKTYTITHN